MKPNRLFYGFEAETVFDPQEPIDGESLLGWIARTTIENALPHVSTIMRDVGQAHRNRVVDVMRKDIDVRGLATILGQDMATVQSMRSEDLGNGLARYLGSIVRTSDVYTRERRFAPASLATDTIPFYRASWLIRNFPVCVDSWQALRSTCSCGTAQTWATVSSLVFCEGCGEDLRELPADVMPEEFRSGITFLADILFGDPISRAAAVDQLPAELRAFDPGEIYELAMLMARIVDPTMGNPREGVWRDEPLRFAQALSTSGTLLARWPDTPWLALAVSGDTKTMLPRCASLKALSSVLNGDYAKNVAPSIRSTLDRIRLAITIDGEKPRDDLIDLNEAAEILGVGKRKVRATRAAGHLGVHFVVRRGEVLPGYARPQVEAMAATAGWCSAAVAAHRAGLPLYGLEQLCAMGEIEWAKSPYRTLRAGLRIKLGSMDSFREALSSPALLLDGLADPVALSVVMRGIGGREKPWGPVMRGLLNREWPYALGRRGRVVREIYVDASNTEAIRQLTFNRFDWAEFPFSRVIHQTDACDILNVPNRSRHLIEPYKVGRHCGRFLFNRESVERIAAETVTSAELGARRFMASKTTMAEIRLARLKTHMFGFDRATAIKNFDSASIRLPR